MGKIGIVTSNAIFAQTAKEVAAELELDVIIQQVRVENAVEAAHKMAKHVDVIIARSLIGHKLEKLLDMTVVVDISNYDLLRTFYAAHQLASQVVFIDAKMDKYSYNMDEVNSMLGFSVERMLCDYADADNIIAGLAGNEVVVCSTDYLMSAAQKRGLQVVQLNPSREDIINAFIKARLVMNLSQREQEKLHWREAMMENTYDGIMSTNKSGIIKSFNRVIGEMTNLRPEEVLDKPIKELILRRKFIKAIYGDGSETLGELVDDGQNKYMVNRKVVNLDKEKPWRTLINVQKISKIQELEAKIRLKLHDKGMIARANFKDIVGNSEVMLRAKDIAKKYAKSNCTILISGESGTGKELFCQSIHNESPCKDGPFLAINCGAFTETLLESELFGYVSGAFTGAQKSGKLGLFELAHGGTLFLDEIGEMPLSLQARLLRVIQEREIIRVGGDRIIPINVRIICASNRNLEQMVQEGKFREDLLYRINVLQLAIPPLRERLKDVPQIAKELINKMNKQLGKNVVLEYELLEVLATYSWPGNVRELANFIDRLMILLDEENISHKFFMSMFNDFTGRKTTPIYLVKPEPKIINLFHSTIEIQVGTMQFMEQQIIDNVLHMVNGDKEKLVATLGLSRTTLWRRLKEIKNGSA